jgi:RNA polymerase sigma-70 factor (ECF subfamily)
MMKSACNLYGRITERMGKEPQSPRERAESKRADREAKLGGLMRLAQAGDKAAYGELLESLALHLRSFLPHALHTNQQGDDGGVEDLLQEVLLAFHQKRHTYDPALPFLPWFYALCRYKIVDRLRAKGSYRRLMEKLSWENSVSESEAGSATESALDVAEVLGTLSSQQRLVLELTKAEGLSVAEAAAKMGLSESNVKVLTFRAIQTIKRKFGRPR